jgi:effector-binding domain-containing protein
MVTYVVTLVDITEQRTVVVATATTWAEYPSLWRELSGEVWACLRAAGITRGCPNVMLYRDDVPNVEVGVLLDQPPPLTGRVTASTLPVGRVATTTHRGPYAGLGAAHAAVADWCGRNGIRPAGPRWEIYGPHDDDPAQLRTDVYWMLSAPQRR